MTSAPSKIIVLTPKKNVPVFEKMFPGDFPLPGIFKKSKIVFHTIPPLNFTGSALSDVLYIVFISSKCTADIKSFAHHFINNHRVLIISTMKASSIWPANTKPCVERFIQTTLTKLGEAENVERIINYLEKMTNELQEGSL